MEEQKETKFCIHCSKEIIKSAEFCNHCGTKQKEKENQESKENNKPKDKTKSVIGISIAIAVFMIMMIGMMFTFYGSCRGDSESSTKEGHSDVEAWIAAQLEVEANLKSPSTAKFPLGTEEHVTKINDNTFKVNAYVDSENSFGAMIRTNFSCTVEFTGEDTYLVKDLEFRSSVGI